ncbi:MAG: helix-turn-helix transcriptional regulator [Bacteroidales bacterium]
MNNRIIQFLTENNLTSTRFADIIGVQRSSVSHILSGRNKPSFDFIEKMLLAYPELNAQWLITGIGSMKISNINKTIEPDLFNNPTNEEKKSTSSDSIIQKQNNETSIINNSHEGMVKKANAETTELTIERIVIFYSDNTFNEYKPH